MRRSNYTIDWAWSSESMLVIKDLGPWDSFLTVTNDAENVVEDLIRGGKLKSGQRLLYRDSEGEVDEILIKDNRFAGFSPGPISKF